jgi:hypothetical protein
VRSFDAWIPMMLDVQDGPGGMDNFGTLVEYMLGVASDEDGKELRARIDQLGRHARRVTMTYAEALRKEGRTDALRQVLLFKFKRKTLDRSYERRLLAATPEMVDEYFRRVLTAASLAAVFED